MLSILRSSMLDKALYLQILYLHFPSINRVHQGHSYLDSLALTLFEVANVSNVFQAHLHVFLHDNCF